jgi:cobalt-zinc-cadmium efflux system outer membrane protein
MNGGSSSVSALGTMRMIGGGRLCLFALRVAFTYLVIQYATETSGVAKPIPATEVVDPPARLPRVLQPLEIESIPTPPGNPPPTALSLADLEELALENNPTLAVARANVAAARGRQVQAGLCPNPVIGYSGMEMGDDGTAGMQGGFIGQQFVTGGKLRYARAVAGVEVQRFRSIFDAQELRVLNDVRLRFYDALVARQQVELTSELADVSRQLVASSQQLLEARQLSENDLLQAEIEAEEIRILANNAENQRNQAWRRLAAAVGVPMLEETDLIGDLTGNIASYDWQESYADLLSRSPEVAAAQARIRATQLAIQRARRENIPNVDVMASVHEMTTDGDTVAGVQVGIPIPILNRNQGNILAAEAGLMAARNDARRVELQLQERLAMAFRNYADARQQAERYQREILPRAQKSLDLVTRGYREGQVDYLILLTSQRTYIRANLAYLSTLAELWQAATLIEGQMLSGSLQAE